MFSIDKGFKLFAFMFLPFFSLISSIVINQNVSLLNGINLMGSLLNKQWSSFVLGAVFSFVISWMLYIAIASGAKFLLIENAVLWILTDDDVISEKIKMGISVFQIAISFLFYIILNSIFNNMFFYSLKEINTAENLITRINQIKASK